MFSKEYNDRWVKPLVNKGFTMEQFERERGIKAFDEFLASHGNGDDCNCKTLINGHANECPRGKK